MTEEELQQLKSNDCDWFLQTLVEYSNHGLSVGLTLTTGAGLISGTLIGGAEYLDMQKTDMAGVFGNDLDRQTFNDIADEWKERYIRPLPDKGEALAPVFIHLKNAQLLDGNHLVPTTRGVLWRGKLDSVIGFNIGSISVTDDAADA